MDVMQSWPMIRIYLISGNHKYNYFMKKYLFSVLFVLFVALASCQNNKSFGVWNYTVEEQPDERAMMLKYFSEIQHDKPLLIFIDEEPFARQIGDTLFYVLHDKDTIYVYNTLSYYVRKIPIDKDVWGTMGGLNVVYYHNHDSVFLLYDSRYVQQPPYWHKERNIKDYDIILINGQGNVTGTYMADFPFEQVVGGEKYNTVITNYRYILGNRLKGDELLINFWTYPYCSNKDFAGFNPPIAAMYNLKTGNCRMLNIHYPADCIGKRYGNNGNIENIYWLMEGRNNDLFVFFEFTPAIYHYDFNKDTMTEWKCRYDNVITTTDSVSMQYGDMAIRYDVPRWCNEENCYFRQMEIIAYKNYKRGTHITQILDADFNHMAYLLGNDNNGIPFSNGGASLTYCYKDKQNHRICFNRKLHKVKLKDFEKSMSPAPVLLNDPLDMADYFHRLHIPDSRSAVLMVNMKYPCSTCYDFIFGTMKNSREAFENNNIYVVSYDPNGTDFLMKSYIEKYGLTNMPNLIKDTTMLESVYSGNMCWGNYPYVLVIYSNGKCMLQFPEFSTLQSMLTGIVTKPAGQKPKEE